MLSSLTVENRSHNPNSDSLSSDLAVIIVSWNVQDLLRNNLKALQLSQGLDKVEVIVVDNASADNTVAMLKQDFPWVKVIANQANLGFAKACNQGIALSKARHILLLNPDMILRPDTLARTLVYAEADPTVGLLSGLIHQEDGTILRSVRRFPAFFDQFLIVTKLAKLFPSFVAHYEGRDLDLTKEQEVDSFRGAYFFIHERALRILGGLDERYFIWFEEVDYCRRARLAGFSVRHVPSIQATDFVGRSFAQRRLFWKQRQISRSMVMYFETWHPWWQALILRVVWKPVVALAWLHDALLRSKKI